MSIDKLEIIEERELLGKCFRVYGTIENPLFVAKDVAEWIECDTSNIGKFLNNIDYEDKVRKYIPTLGGYQEMWMLSEDGVYEVLMQSRKPLAKVFKTKVKEILKSIRKNGMYAKDELLNNPELLLDIALRLKEEKDKVNCLQLENEELKQKAEIYDDIIDSNELLNFKQIADAFGVCGRNTLMQTLRDNKILSDNGFNKNLPYSQYERMGLFKVKMTPRKTNNGMENICTTLCTTKAIPFIKKILDKKKDLQIS